MPIHVKGQLYTDSNSNPIQALVGSGTRVNLAAQVASSNATLPVGTDQLLIVRCNDYVWMNFGAGGVTASAANTSVLVPPGERLVPVPTTATTVAVLRSGAADAIVQVESLYQG